MEEEYDIMLGFFDGGDKYDMSPPIVSITTDVEEASISNSSRRIFGLKMKRSKKAT